MQHWINWTAGKRRIPIAPLLAMALAAAVLTACGPAAQLDPEGSASLPTAQESEVTPTPAPTPTPTPAPSERVRSPYPRLDPTLQQLVQKFEAEELTESQAAAQAPLSHRSSVLVEVQTSEADIDNVDAWMGTQEITPRFPSLDFAPPLIYAYAKVSHLGALSQVEGVSMVRAIEFPYEEGVAVEGEPEYNGGPKGVIGAGGATETKLPLWLKGYPYPNLLGDLQEIVYRYEQGELTEAQAATEIGYNQGSSVHVVVDLNADPAKTDAVVAWLKGKGVSPYHVDKHEVFINGISALVPVSILAELSRQPGVFRVTSLGFFQPSPPGPQSSVPLQSQPTSTPRQAHGATAWHTGTPSHKGSGVKVGIIDKAL